MCGGPGRRVWIEDVEEEVALFEANHFVVLGSIAGEEWGIRSGVAGGLNFLAVGDESLIRD